ncbi:MAG: ABC transporter substrate-binding protein [Myxococcales bacterium]|nr:ABC transporter substrate-binding protein [Myxococcales bacterium]
MTLRTLSVGGVPEHFNVLWHWGREHGDFAGQGLDLLWQDFPGGTGALVSALTAGSVDVAVMLTEGAIAAREQRADVHIVSQYVSSPLTWGVHVRSSSEFRDDAALGTCRVAISRFGSGSHLMALIEARRRGVNPADMTFVVVSDLAGARAALAEGRADFFLWEKYTTKPLVDSGEWRRVGEVVTPWPAFVVTARADWAQANALELQRVLSVLDRRATAAYADPHRTVNDVAARYGLLPVDVSAWLATTQWSPRAGMGEATERCVVDHLRHAGVLP